MGIEEIKVLKKRILDDRKMFENILKKSKEQLAYEEGIKYEEADDEYRKILEIMNEIYAKQNILMARYRELEIKNEPLAGEEQALLKGEIDNINRFIEDNDIKGLKQIRNLAFEKLLNYQKEDFKRKLLELPEAETVYSTGNVRGPVSKVMADNLFLINGKYKYYDECTLEEKQNIRDYNEEVKKIKLSEDEKYNQKGKFTVCLIFPNTNACSDLEIELTPRQMAEAGILYNEPYIYWKSNEQLKIEEGLKAKDAGTIKSVLLNGDSEIVHVYTSIGSNQKCVPKISKAMPKKLFELGEFDIGMPGSIYVEQQGGGDLKYKNEYTLDAIGTIAERSQKIEVLMQKMKNSKTDNYDKKGIISIPIYKTNSRTIR